MPGSPSGMPCEIVPYLHALGITHCYASPFLQARPGSTHGYDITNHQAFNPEIGTEADYDALCQALQAHGMGQILDIVPNHMGVTGNDNRGGATCSKTARPRPMPASSTLPGMPRPAWRCTARCCSPSWGSRMARRSSPRRSAWRTPPGRLPCSTLTTVSGGAAAATP